MPHSVDTVFNMEHHQDGASPDSKWEQEDDLTPGAEPLRERERERERAREREQGESSEREQGESKERESRERAERDRGEREREQ